MAKKARKAKGKNGSRGMPPKTNNLVSAMDAQKRRIQRDVATAKKSMVTRRSGA